ncbi:probable tRNA (cytosine(38)-C(5))-methyltransferase [Coccomyxa sp. Obi]|nr:probable tRNA (cytosine(38)-C(5))-methyltransferase [Coccomyxa sp. Obi]
MLDGEPLRAVEFYSGIGGMHFGLRKACPEARVVAAFDLNEVANDVYEHNFGWRPWQGNLEGVPASVLDGFKAHLWMMAPPCQPFTRRGLQQDINDPRSASFLKLIGLLPTLQHPPQYVIVENVVGFEGSSMRKQLAAGLDAAGLDMQEFLLSPLQLGVPYSRPRYYALARRRTPNGACPFPRAPLLDSQPLCCPATSLLSEATDLTPLAPRLHSSTVSTGSAACGLKVEPCSARGAAQHTDAQEGIAEVSTGVQPIAAFLVDRPDPGDGVSLQQSSSGCVDGEENLIGQAGGSASTSGDGQEDFFWVPDNVIEQWGEVLDIVVPSSQRCNCFTKTYSRYTKGSGSQLATSNLGLVRPRPGLHPGDLTLKPDTSALELERQRMAEAAHDPSSDLGTSPIDGQNTSPGDEVPAGSHVTRSGRVSTRPREYDGLSREQLHAMRLRYFTPREIANLHSFPAGFGFPAHITLRQRYALLGNSLSALVVADLLRYLLRSADSERA